MIRVATTVALLALPCMLFAQTQSWELRYGSTEDEIFYNGIEDINGDFVLCGQIGTLDTFAYGDDGYLRKLNAGGDTLLSKRYSLPGLRVSFTCVTEVNDGYLFFGHYVDLVQDSGNKVLVLKTDFGFEEQWVKTWGSASYFWQSINNVRKETDSTLIAIGSASGNGNASDIFICRFNLQGDSLFGKYHDFDPSFADGWDIFPTPYGYKAFVSGIPPNGGPEVQLLSLDTALDTLSLTNIDSLHPTEPVKFYGYANGRQLNDSTMIVFARMDFSLFAAYSGFGYGLLHFSLDDTLRKALFFGKEYKPDIAAYHGMDYVYPSSIYCGGTADIDTDAWWWIWSDTVNWYGLAKIDEAGNVLWEKYYGGDSYYMLQAVIATRDSGCLLIGIEYDSETANGYERDIYIIKVGPDGEFVSTKPTAALPHATFAIYPNPAIESFIIRSNFNLPAFIELYDITGRLAHRQQVTSNMQQISVQGLAPGLYVYRLQSKGREARGKIIIE